MNNQDIISRSALIAVTQELCDAFEVNWTDKKVLAWIKTAKIPAVDAVEVVHGRWESMDDNSWRCSVCHRENCYAYDELSKRLMDYYCPKCGAKMDGERKGDDD